MNMSLYCYKGVVDPVETWVNARSDSNCKVEQTGKVEYKLEATVIGNVEELSVVVLVA